MKLISHRGNLEGRIPEKENDPKYILEALRRGFEVEIDLWIKEKVLYLGHDEPQYEIEENFLQEHKERFWIHAKNIEASEWITNTDLHWFWHENDKMVLTSKNIIWSNVGVYVRKGITVEFGFNQLPDYILGVCSDFISKYGTRST